MTEKKTRVRSPWGEVQARSRTIRKSLEQVLEDVRKLIATPGGDPVSAHKILKGEIEAWKVLVTAAGEELSATVGRLEKERAEALEYLVDHLTRELKKQGHQIFGSTSPLVVDGIVHVELTAERGVVSVDGEAQEDVSVASLVRVISEQVSEIKKAHTSPGDLLQELATAYQRELKLTEKPDGTQLPVLSLLPHILFARQTAAFRGNPLARAFREYPREQFRADLHGLLESGLAEVAGMRFRYASGADTNGAVFMYVPALERTAHVGRVWFERS